VKSKKVCIVGLDGVGFKNITLFLKQATINNIRYIVSKGCACEFISIPPYTPIAWTSILTGVNPGKHGVYGFLKVDRVSNRFRDSAATSFDVMYPRIFEILAMQGLRSIVINVPLTDGLASRENIIVVSDWASPRQFIYPRSYENKYREFLIDPPHEWFKAASEGNYVRRVEKFLKKRLNLYLDLLENEDFNLFVIIFSELDWLMHRIPDIVSGRRAGLAHEILSLIDKFVGKALQKCDLTVLVSDHGFTVARLSLGVNSILARIGLLSYSYRFDLSKVFGRDNVFSGLKTGSKSLFDSKTATNILKTSFEFVKRLLPPHILGKLESTMPIRTTIDYSSSKAFMVESGNWGVYVRQGYEELVKRVLRETGLVKEAIESGTLFWGPCTRLAPDIILVPKEGVLFDARVYSEPVYETYCGEHNPQAMIALYGDSVSRNNAERFNITIYDIIPTVLAYLGLPIPYDSDGRVLRNLFDIELHCKKYDYTLRFKVARSVKKLKAYKP